jgi:hypothetical protein
MGPRHGTRQLTAGEASINDYPGVPWSSWHPQATDKFAAGTDMKVASLQRRRDPSRQRSAIRARSTRRELVPTGTWWHQNVLVEGTLDQNRSLKHTPDLPSHGRSRPTARWPVACGTSGVVSSPIWTWSRSFAGRASGGRPRRVGARSWRGARDGNGFRRALLVVRG